jgi:hypothetical protein
LVAEFLQVIFSSCPSQSFKPRREQISLKFGYLPVSGGNQVPYACTQIQFCIAAIVGSPQTNLGAERRQDFPGLFSVKGSCIGDSCAECSIREIDLLLVFPSAAIAANPRKEFPHSFKHILSF